MSDDNDQKTEQPTGKKLGKAYGEGQFPRTPDIGVACVLLATLILFAVQIPDIARAISAETAHTFQNLGRTELSPEKLTGALLRSVTDGIKLLGPLLAIIFVAAVAAGGMQSHFRLTFEVVGFNVDKLNPANGLKNLFSKQTLVALPFDLLKMGGVGLALWMAIKKIMRDPLFYSPMEAGHLALFLHRVTITLVGWVAGVMTVIAVASYAYQHFKFMKDMRMTKQEVKDEMKQAEGDPQVKSRRRRMALRLMQKQMLGAVPTADVVVTNPTHYAVALKYERGVDAAPIVLAKGENRFAMRIKEIARENGVPIVENKPVARMLYKIGEVGEPVPLQVYRAVAEILAFVYRTHRYYFHQLKSRRAAAAQAAAGPRALVA